MTWWTILGWLFGFPAGLVLATGLAIIVWEWRTRRPPPQDPP